MSEGFSGSDLVIWLREAAYLAVRRSSLVIEHTDLQGALDQCILDSESSTQDIDDRNQGYWKPGISEEYISQLESFHRKKQ